MALKRADEETVVHTVQIFPVGIRLNWNGTV
jgi:hypothetical protein